MNIDDANKIKKYIENNDVKSILRVVREKIDKCIALDDIPKIPEILEDAREMISIVHITIKKGIPRAVEVLHKMIR